MLDAFCKNVNGTSIRVYPPRRSVLICGGEVSNITEEHPISIRDAFLRGGGESCLPKADFIRIENLDAYFEKDSPYHNLIEFERDIAQLSELVILIPESPGSFAELGSFSMIDEIKSKLLVAIRSKYATKNSFIKNGPLLSISEKGANASFSLPDSLVGIRGDNVASIDCAALVNILKAPIESRLGELEEKTTFDKRMFNHVSKLYIALLREFYVLKDLEILKLFRHFGVEIDDDFLDRMTFCCSALRWSASSRAGFDRIHFALKGNEAAKFEMSKEYSDKIRRRTELASYWKSHDPLRIAVVDEVLRQ